MLPSQQVRFTLENCIFKTFPYSGCNFGDRICPPCPKLFDRVFCVQVNGQWRSGEEQSSRGDLIAEKLKLLAPEAEVVAYSAGEAPDLYRWQESPLEGPSDKTICVEYIIIRSTYLMVFFTA